MPEVNDFLLQLQQIDYASIIRIISPVITGYVTNRVISGYCLHKDFKPTNISKVSLPPELIPNYSDVDFDKFISEEFGKQLAEFSKTLIEKFPATDLTNFYNNINELKFSSKNSGLINVLFKGHLGAYNTRKNRIRTEKWFFSLIVLYHELFHMASTVYKNGMEYSGFLQGALRPKIIYIGFGLNEGYTELLTKRYFKEKCYDYIDMIHDSYSLERSVAEKIEEIVGQEKMESLYLNANLLGLINELKKYASEEEVMDFIAKVDFLQKHRNEKWLLPFKKKMVNSSLKTIHDFLLKAYIVKQKERLDNGEIGMKKFRRDLTEYISSLRKCFTDREHRYDFLTKESVEEILKTLIDSSELIDKVIQNSSIRR